MVRIVNSISILILNELPNDPPPCYFQGFAYFSFTFLPKKACNLGYQIDYTILMFLKRQFQNTYQLSTHNF